MKHGKKKRILLKLIIVVVLFLIVLEAPFVPKSISDPIHEAIDKGKAYLSGLLGYSQDNIKKLKTKVDQIVESGNPESSQKTDASGIEKLEQIVSDYAKEHKIPEASTSIQDKMEIPGTIKGHQVVAHNGYTLSYNEKHEQADWVAYVLTVDQLNNKATGRTEDFREDEDIITGSATLEDYKGSGYDRGHLCNSADRTYSEEVNSETFLLSNMSPQIHRFNAGLFLKSEDAFRDAARMYGTVYIATGPVLTSDSYETIGDSKVSVPDFFYKAILAFDDEGNAYTIGLLMPQDYKDGNLKPYFRSIDNLEKITGLDFFPHLEDEVENKTEASYDLSCWPSSFR